MHYKVDFSPVGKSSLVSEPIPPPSASHHSPHRQSHCLCNSKTTAPTPIGVEWTTNHCRLSSTFVALYQSRHQQFNGRSFQDYGNYPPVNGFLPEREKDEYDIDHVEKYNELFPATLWPTLSLPVIPPLRDLLQPDENHNPRLAFYNKFKRETDEYDIDYVKKYNEDLDSTLIFASLVSFAPTSYLTHPYSQACSPPSLPPSSASSQCRNWVWTGNPQLFSPPSVNLIFHLFKKLLRGKFSPPSDSHTRVS